MNHAKNRVKYLARRGTRQQTSLDEVDESALRHVLSQRPSRPDRMLMGRELEGVLQQAIASLEEEHRTLISAARDREPLLHRDQPDHRPGGGDGQEPFAPGASCDSRLRSMRIAQVSA